MNSIQNRLRDRSVLLPNGCIETTFKKNVWGYGQMKVNGKLVSCHRVSFELENGAIPKGLCVLHSCDNPACVNPKHLSLGTNSDNVSDMVAKNRHPHNETNGRSKLTQSLVSEIRKSKRSAAGIARELGMNQKHIERIKRGLFWRDVPVEEEQ